MPIKAKNPPHLGATYLGGGRTEFWVFAPNTSEMTLHILSPIEQWLPMEPKDQGYFHCLANHVDPGALYRFAFKNQEYPDPASRYQPQGVFGPSQVINPDFLWTDVAWRGLTLAHYLIYELHVGTFTQEGTFTAIISHLDELHALGITAIELMPIAQFSGDRNWGYDGVFPFAVQNTYGTPQQLKQLIDAAHQRGVAVILDVVYNHLGPEGNVLPEFGPYFTDRYHTPWGAALNFDGAYNNEVRHYFIENALMWARDYHIDALRLDALHAVFDYSAYPFLAELADKFHQFAHESNRQLYLIAESALNDSKLVRPQSTGGYGLDAQWNDDFHHALHTLLTGEQDKYYQDFGSLEQLAKAFREGYVYSGEFSQFRQRHHGHSSREIPAEKFIVFAQNHDQVGNRLFGERLSQLMNFDQLKLAAGIVLLSPFIPLLFMGEEYGETAPFHYMTSHTDPTLIAAVRKGRKEEMAFDQNKEIPDPQNPEMFMQSKLNRQQRLTHSQQTLYHFYQALIQLRKSTPALAQLNNENMSVHADSQQQILFLHRWHHANEVIIIYHFADHISEVKLPIPPGQWKKIFASTEQQWRGSNHPLPNTLEGKLLTSLELEPFAFAVFESINSNLRS